MLSRFPRSLALALACALPLSAQVTIPITNASFEADAIAEGTFQVYSGLPQGWSHYDPSGILNGADNAVGVLFPRTSPYFPAGAPDGDNAALIFLGGPQNLAAGLQQTLAASLTADTRYTLRVAVGNIASGTSLPGSADGGGQFYDLSGFPGYRVELLAGSSVIAVDDNSLAAEIAEGEFQFTTITYDALAGDPLLGQALTIRLINLDQTTGTEVDFDDVSLTASAIPEPATCAAFASLAALALAAFRRRRRAV